MSSKSHNDTTDEMQEWRQARKIFIRTVSVCLALTALAATGHLLRWHIIRFDGDRLAAAGDYTRALELYGRAGEHIDAADRQANASYMLGRSLMESGSYNEAAEIFFELSDYEDSAELYNDCRYEEAVRLCDDGSYSEALSILRTLGSYKDSESYMLEAGRAIFGESYTGGAEALSSLSDEELAAQALLSERRETLLSGRIAAGFSHTVGLKADGTVLAVGSNGYGQCDVGGWSNVVAVDAGAYFTVGLKKDGSVVFAGRSDYGEACITEISDVTAISAGYDFVAALRSDGAVISFGRCEMRNSESWQNITAIKANASQLVAVTDKGYALSERPSLVNEYYSGLASVGVGDSYSIGVTATGSLVSSTEELDLSSFEPAAAVECGSNGFIVIKADGTTDPYFFREEYAFDTSSWHDVAEIDMGGTHCAALLSDGTVVASGRNDCGQCNVSDWNLLQ